jgi:hypothetical protein
MIQVMPFTVGDQVWIGKPAPQTAKVVWRIVGLHENGAGTTYATLRSGQTERSRVAPVERLTHFRILEEAA